MPKVPSNLHQFSSLVEIVAALRGPEGCPWDKEQTHRSLTQYAIEEVFELVDAIEKNQDSLIKEELGDNLFQVVLHTVLASERHAFQMDDVIQTISEKLIRRHPHVFGDTKVASTDDVIANWELIKKSEKKNKVDTSDPLNVPRHLPALQKAYKIGKRTEKLRFDWENSTQVLEKVKEEEQELAEAMLSQDKTAIAHELGDVLFSLAQLARHLDLEPEQVLRQANQRFENRFAGMLKICEERNLNFENLTAPEKEALWTEVKKL